MARKYGTFTPARRAALKRASLLSAQKRRGSKRGSRNFARPKPGMKHRAVGSFGKPKGRFAKGSKTRKALKYAAYGAAAVGAVGVANTAINYKSAGGKKSHGSYGKYAKKMHGYNSSERASHGRARKLYKNKVAQHSRIPARRSRARTAAKLRG